MKIIKSLAPKPQIGTVEVESLIKMIMFFFEVGSLRKLPRAHQQNLLTTDVTDNISSHSFRVTVLGYFLASMIGADANKVTKMCLLHDLAETRSGDHHWVAKSYVKVYDEEILNDQFKDLPFGEELFALLQEYHERKTSEALVAKDADLLEQVFLLIEYADTGNKEAARWLHEDELDKNQQIKNMTYPQTKRLAALAIGMNPSDWWAELWTNKNR